MTSCAPRTPAAAPKWMPPRPRQPQWWGKTPSGAATAPPLVSSAPPSVSRRRTNALDLRPTVSGGGSGSGVGVGSGGGSGGLGGAIGECQPQRRGSGIGSGGGDNDGDGAELMSLVESIDLTDDDADAPPRGPWYRRRSAWLAVGGAAAWSGARVGRAVYIRWPACWRPRRPPITTVTRGRPTPTSAPAPGTPRRAAGRWMSPFSACSRGRSATTGADPDVGLPGGARGDSRLSAAHAA